MTIAAQSADNPGLQDINNYASNVWQDVQIPPIRIESMPSLITVHACRQSDDMESLSALNSNFSDREYHNPIRAFSLTLNEKLNALSDRDQWDMWKLYRMYSESKMSFEDWRDLRCIIALRSDCLALDKGQSIFSPSTLSFKLQVARRIDELVDRTAKTCRIHINFWYMNMALSVSSQSAAVTDLLLNASDASRAGVSAQSAKVTDIMSKAY